MLIGHTGHNGFDLQIASAKSIKDNENNLQFPKLTILNMIFSKFLLLLEESVILSPNTRPITLTVLVLVYQKQSKQLQKKYNDLFREVPSIHFYLREYFRDFLI